MTISRHHAAHTSRVSFLGLMLAIAVTVIAAPAGAQFAFEQEVDVVDLAYPWDTDIADVDGDGWLDMIVCLPDEDASLTVYLNDGSGGFDAGTGYALGDWGDAADVGDLDGDGDPDIAVVLRHFTLSITTLLNDGNGQFVVGGVSPVAESSEDIALGDLDGDGDLDALLAIWGFGAMSVVYGDGAGGFTGEVVIPVDGGNCFGVTAADLDGDGDLEAAIACSGDVPTNSGKLHVFDNPGTGVFGQETTYAVHKGVWSIDAGDMDGDGDIDLLTTNRNVNSVSVFLNDSAGHFAPQLTTTVGTFPTDGHLADFDGDQDLDVVVPSSNSNDIHVLENDGSGGMSTALVIPTAHWHQSGDVGDLDGDGKLDFVSGSPWGMDRFTNVGDLDPWLDLGAALAGASGVPALEGTGSLTPGSLTTLTLTGGNPLAAATLVIGFSQLGAPFKGGTLVPAPDVLIALALDAGGGLALSANWPGGVPGGTELVLQYWIVDAGGPKGFAASNGVVGTAP